MPGLIDRLISLAAEAAKVAEELTSGTDSVSETLEALRRHHVTVTHAGHVSLEQAALRVTGESSFTPEELIIRSKGNELEFHYQAPLPWLAFSKQLEGNGDVLLSLELEVEPSVVLGVFLRNISDDGNALDGERIVVQGGSIGLHRLVRAAPSLANGSHTSLFVVLNNLRGPFILRSLIITEVP